MPLSATPRQMDLLRFIRGYQLAKGYSPSFREMLPALGCRSHNTTARLLHCLEERGWIRRLPNRERAIEVLVKVPVPHAPDGAPLQVVPGPWEARA